MLNHSARELLGVEKLSAQYYSGLISESSVDDPPHCARFSTTIMLAAMLLVKYSSLERKTPVKLIINWNWNRFLKVYLDYEKNLVLA